MPEPGYFHLHLVSDATGETLITVARAAAAQYANVSPVEHLYPMVRSKKQLDSALAEITEAPGLVLYTLLEEDLIKLLEDKCRDLALPCMSVLGPILRLFQSYLGTGADISWAISGLNPGQTYALSFQDVAAMVVPGEAFTVSAFGSAPLLFVPNAAYTVEGFLFTALASSGSIDFNGRQRGTQRQ